MSRPARPSPMVRDWIGNGSVMPSRARAAARSEGRPKAPNVGPATVALMEGCLAFVVWMIRVRARTPREELPVGRYSVRIGPDPRSRAIPRTEGTDSHDVR